MCKINQKYRNVTKQQALLPQSSWGYSSGFCGCLMKWAIKSQIFVLAKLGQFWEIFVNRLYLWFSGQLRLKLSPRIWIFLTEYFLLLFFKLKSNFFQFFNGNVFIINGIRGHIRWFIFFWFKIVTMDLVRDSRFKLS